MFNRKQLVGNRGSLFDLTPEMIGAEYFVHFSFHSFFVSSVLSVRRDLCKNCHLKILFYVTYHTYMQFYLSLIHI